jgi:hypothetical protein
MVDDVRSRFLEPALVTVAGLHLGGLAFTESFRELPAVAAAYAAAWWIVRMGS